MPPVEKALGSVGSSMFGVEDATCETEYGGEGTAFLHRMAMRWNSLHLANSLSIRGRTL
jgi:hypothetical protein